MTYRMLPELGVLVVEVTEPLGAQDFDALAATADAWLAIHDALPGVVVHARAFPSWENVGRLLRHVRFVRDHHRAVRRVALAVDGPIADLAPRLAEHFVRAELRHFGYDELDDAVVWAAGQNGRLSTAAGPDATRVQRRARVSRPAPSYTVYEDGAAHHTTWRAESEPSTPATPRRPARRSSISGLLRLLGRVGRGQRADVPDAGDLRPSPQAPARVTVACTSDPAPLRTRGDHGERLLRSRGA